LIAVSAALAVHVIFVTASVTVSPSLVLIGVASLLVSVVAVHPGTGMIDTEAIGLSAGRLTSSLVVEAVSLSVGTRNATRA
jgi:hypothetical protein